MSPEPIMLSGIFLGTRPRRRKLPVLVCVFFYDEFTVYFTGFACTHGPQRFLVLDLHLCEVFEF